MARGTRGNHGPSRRCALRTVSLASLSEKPRRRDYEGASESESRCSFVPLLTLERAQQLFRTSSLRCLDFAESGQKAHFLSTEMREIKKGPAKVIEMPFRTATNP